MLQQQYLVFFAIVVLGIMWYRYSFCSITQPKLSESFTDVQFTLAKQLLAMFKSPPHNYYLYGTILTQNKNTSKNITSKTVYTDLTNKGASIVLADILATMY